LKAFRKVVRLLFGWKLLGVWLESVASPGDSDNLGVVEQAIENGASGGRSSSKQAATCLRVVPWMRLSATLLSQ